LSKKGSSFHQDRASHRSPAKQDVDGAVDRVRAFQQRKASPMPIGESCNTLCPLFKCTRGALFIHNRPYRGKMVKETLCRLTGEKCVGYECQYAGCKVNALLPDGKCAKALERKYKTISEEELFREMQRFEDYDVDDFL